MTTLILINQPETTWSKDERCEGISDTSISKRGKKQISAVAMSLLGQSCDKLICSTLNRSVQCGKIFIKYFPIKLFRDKRLNEINYGIWQGKFPEEIQSRYPAIWNTWLEKPSDATIPDGERYPEVQCRVKEFLKSLENDTLYERQYIILTHDIIIRTILAQCSGKEDSDIWTFQISPASVFKVSIEPEKKILTLE